MADLGLPTPRSTRTRRYAAALVGTVGLALATPAPLLAPATPVAPAASAAGAAAPPAAPPAPSGPGPAAPASTPAPRRATSRNPLAPRIPSGGTVDSCSDPTVL